MSAAPPEVTKQSNVTVITLGPGYENIEEANVPLAESAILKAIDAADPPWVVIDLPHTKFFGSSFIAVLLAARSRVNGLEGGQLAISSLTPYCAEVLEMTRFDKICKICSTPADAVRDFNG
jgi:anti-sigma B factor antagonist